MWLPLKEDNMKTPKQEILKPEEKKQSPTLRFFTSVAVPQDLLTTEVAAFELSKRQKIFLWLGFVLLFVVFFLIGLAWFFPLDRLALHFLNKDYVSVSTTAEDAQLSLRGNFTIKNLAVESFSNPAISASLKNVAGKTSPLTLWRGKEGKTNFTIHNLQLKIPVLQSFIRIHGGTWQVKSRSSLNKKNLSLSRSQIQIVPENIFINYEDIVPFLNEKIQLLITNGSLDLLVENQVLIVASSQIFSDLFEADINGRIPMQGESMSLSMILKPTDLFFNKYSAMGIDQILRSMNILKDDGKIYIQLSGSLTSPQVQTQ